MKKVVFLLLASLTLAISLSGHSGRTDSQGCHTDRKTGIYHCH